MHTLVAPVVVRPFTHKPAEFDPEVARELAALTAWPKDGVGCNSIRHMGFSPVKVKPRPPYVPPADESWRAEAACKGMDTALWFPEVGQIAHEAREVCATCPVADPCGEYGKFEKFGIWGGMNDRDRRDLRRGVTVERKLPVCGEGTSAYRRHKRRGEEPCDLCKEFMRVHWMLAGVAKRAKRDARLARKKAA